jgi:hypothetical protein
MLSEPVGDGVGGPIREERHGLAALQVHEDGAIRLSLPQRKIVHPEHGGRDARRDGQPAEQAQQSVPADGHAELLAQQLARGPTQR